MYPVLHWGALCTAPGKVAGKEADTSGMGCTASVVQLQALRSLMRANCARACSDRQDQISLEVLQSLDSEADSRPRTIIITVIRFRSLVGWFSLGRTAFGKARLRFAGFFICFPSAPLVVSVASWTTQCLTHKLSICISTCHFRELI